jgi:hypothetical protein
MITLALGPACAAHQLQARLQPAVIGLGPVVGGLLGSVPRWREQLLEHHRVGRCRSVTTSTGATFVVPIARSKKRGAAVASHHGKTTTSMI